MAIIPHHRLIYGILAAIILVFAAAAAYSYYVLSEKDVLLEDSLIRVKESAGRIEVLERQVAALNLAVQSSLSTNEETRKKLQEQLSSISKMRLPAAAISTEEQITGAVSRAAPAVVSIVVSKDVPLLQVQYIDPFGEGASGLRVPVFRNIGTQAQRVGAGTGFIVRSDGYILTNRHVVADTSADYTVLLSTGEKKDAQVVYRDPTNDIAILKISGTGYARMVLGDSGSLRLGQSVLAIGNALGEYNNSVSVGIVSGLNRSITAQDERGNPVTLSNVIQTDAAINRGNSGGPLLDLAGQVIGINVAIERGANNIAFAIPISQAKAIINQVLP